MNLIYLDKFSNYLQEILSGLDVSGNLNDDLQLTISTTLTVQVDNCFSYINKSILFGENYYISSGQIHPKFDEIAARLTDIDKNLSKIIAKSADTYKDYFLSLKKQFIRISELIEIYHELISITNYELENFGSSKKTFHQYKISRSIDFDAIRNVLLSTDITTGDAKKDLLIPTLVKLNLILAEYDYYLNCSNELITSLLDIYVVFEYLEDKLKTYSEASNVYQKILQAKCALLLKKALARREDLEHSVSYYSYVDKNLRILSFSNIVVNDYKEFFSLLDKRYKNNFPINNSVEFANAKNAFESGLQNNEVNYISLHYLCKYYKLTETINSEKKLAELDNLYQSITNNTSNGKKFDKLAKIAAEFHILKTKLHICYIEVKNNCERKNDGKIKEWQGKLEEIYMLLNDKYDSSNTYRDFHYHKLYLQSILKIGEYYIELADNNVDQTTSKIIDLEKHTRVIDDLGVLMDSCVLVLPDYKKNIKWSKMHHIMPYYLPLNQCFCESNIITSVDDPDFRLFLDSTFIRPINYQKEDENYSQIDTRVWQIVEKTLRHNRLIFVATESAILNKSNEAIQNALQESSSRINKQIGDVEILTKEKITTEVNNSNIKSVQFLTIFSGLITLTITALAGFIQIKDPRIYVNVLLVIGAVLFSFVTFIAITIMPLTEVKTLITGDVKRKVVGENIIKMLLMFIVVGLLVYVSYDNIHTVSEKTFAFYNSSDKAVHINLYNTKEDYYNNNNPMPFDLKPHDTDKRDRDYVVSNHPMYVDWYTDDYKQTGWCASSAFTMDLSHHILPGASSWSNSSGLKEHCCRKICLNNTASETLWHSEGKDDISLMLDKRFNAFIKIGNKEHKATYEIVYEDSNNILIELRDINTRKVIAKMQNDKNDALCNHAIIEMAVNNAKYTLKRKS